MKEYLKRVLNGDMSIIHGVYEPPNNIPIMRYLVNRKDYKVILIGDTSMKLSCLKWLATENIIPYYIFSTFDELDNVDKSNKYFLVISDPDYKYTSYITTMFNQMKKNNIEHFLCPYDFEKIPKHDTNYLEYFSSNEENILDMFDMLNDQKSKQVYIEYIRSKMFCDFYRLEQEPTWKKYFDEDVYKHLNSEVFVNCGSSNGDTIFYYLEKFNDFSKIFALEGDYNRFKQFGKNMIYLENDVKSKIVGVNRYVDNDINKLDDIFLKEPISLINMDIEGMELDALKGAKRIIEQNKPVIAACAYHLPTDLYELPMYLINLSDDYEIVYRKYASTVRNRFCNAELVMYGVPKKRLVK